MINKAAITNFHFRWLHAVVWGLYALVLFSWLFAPMLRSRYGDVGAWWFPDVFVHYALFGMTNRNLLDMGAQGFAGVLGGDPDNLVDYSGGSFFYAVVVFFVLLGLAGSAWMFLFSGRDALNRLPARRKFSVHTVIACALMFALLSVGLVSGVLEHLDYWEWFVEELPYRVLNGEFTSASRSRWPVAKPSVVPASLLLLVAWMAWAVVLWTLRQRKQQYWQFERMTLWLMIPALILLVTPLFMDMLDLGPDTRTRWRNAPDGRYTTRVFAATVLLWAWGCRVILLFQLQRYRLQAIDNPEQICFACGYDLRGTVSAGLHQCPECGSPVTVLADENEAASV